MKKLWVQFNHWLCGGIYVRTRTRVASLSDRYPQLERGYIFECDELIINAAGVTIKDKQGCYHKWRDVRPSVPSEQELYLSPVRNPKKQPIKSKRSAQ